MLSRRRSVGVVRVQKPKSTGWPRCSDRQKRYGGVTGFVTLESCLVVCLLGKQTGEMFVCLVSKQANNHKKELCCVLEKPSVARGVLAPRVMAMFKFLQAGQLFNKKSLKLKYI